MAEVEIRTHVDLIPDEFCPDKTTDIPCRTEGALVAGVHCDHWYEDEGCHVCHTEEPNLVIFET